MNRVLNPSSATPRRAEHGEADDEVEGVEGGPQRVHQVPVLEAIAASGPTDQNKKIDKSKKRVENHNEKNYNEKVNSHF